MKKVVSVAIIVVALVVFLVGFGTVSVAAETADGYTYSVVDGEAVILSADLSISGDVIIPTELGGYPVTGIGEGAFWGCDGITNITIPNTVTDIGLNAFYGCMGLTDVTIPSGVINIGNAAFYDCENIISVTIPDSVTSIGISAFEGCDSLISVTIPDSVTSIGNAAFYDCDALTSVSLPNGIPSISDDMFYGCINLTSITIPNSVTKIGRYAFFCCEGLTNITIPDSVTSISDFAFRWCTGLKSVTISDSVMSIGGGVFRYCSGLKDVWYTGSDRSEMTIKTGNITLIKATWHYNTCKDEHTYMAACDAYCDQCEWTREDVEEHTYDNACDTTCNACDASRTTTHSFETTTNKATLTQDGSIVTMCTVCGEVESSITIPYPETIVLSATSYTYNGSVRKPTVTVKDTAGTVIAPSNYTVTYASGRKNVGVYTVKVRMNGEYSGEKTLTFKINPINISKCSAKLSTTSVAYSGAVRVPAVTVKNMNGTVLTKGTHYTVSRVTACQNVGTHKVLIKMKGNYTGSKTLTFKINPINISQCSVNLSATSVAYSGAVRMPAVTVKNMNGTVLTKGTHYTVSRVTTCQNVGTHKVLVKMKGNYAGNKTLTFKINPVKTTVSKITPATKSLKVSITKKSTQVTGYQVQYSTSQSFKTVKTVNIDSYKTTATTIKSLKAKTTYYVRARTYKTVKGTKYYSDWSVVKAAKTK